MGNDGDAHEPCRLPPGPEGTARALMALPLVTKGRPLGPDGLFPWPNGKPPSPHPRPPWTLGGGFALGSESRIGKAGQGTSQDGQTPAKPGQTAAAAAVAICVA